MINQHEFLPFLKLTKIDFIILIFKNYLEIFEKNAFKLLQNFNLMNRFRNKTAEISIYLKNLHQ